MRELYYSFKKNDFISKLRYFIVFALCVFTAVCLLSYPQKAKDSIAEAVKICGETVVPSLFPFMFLSSFMISYGLTGENSRILRFVSKKLFDLPPTGISVFFLSTLGGFPVGAKMTKELLSDDALSKSSAQRLIASCVNPSPSFAVTAVGLCIFGSAKTGMIIYSSVIVSNILILFLSRFIFEKDFSLNNDFHKQSMGFSASFVSAGKKASEAMISVCCYVLLFSCLCEIAGCLFENETVLSALSGILEVTTGCRRLAAPGNVPLIAGVIGWGGLSVHFQIMDCIEKSQLDLKLFFAFRAVCAFLSVFICDLLLKLFPTVAQTVSLRGDVIVRQTQKSIPLSVMMLLACFVFLIGDCTVKIGKKKS